jgi:hypothetical protein
MIDKLPYQLTAGVTATREGLVFGDSSLWIKHAFADHGFRLVLWPDVSERLQYREGEPWCREHQEDNSIVCEPIGDGDLFDDYGGSLHRLAAILCDDVEAFRVLHWCVYILGQDVDGAW